MNTLGLTAEIITGCAAQHLNKILVGINTALNLSRVIAVTFFAAINRAYGFTETVITDNRSVGRAIAGTALRHPEPDRCTPRGCRILCNLIGIGPQIQPQSLPCNAVIIIPAQLDWAATIITFAGSTHATGSCGT